jgi:hypothetical protein
VAQRYCWPSESAFGTAESAEDAEKNKKIRNLGVLRVLGGLEKQRLNDYEMR